MNRHTADRWKNEALDTVFAALAASATLTARLIYKGARVLNLLLNDAARQSLDIDANLTRQFVQEYPSRKDQCKEIDSEIRIALTHYFDSQEEVYYAVEQVLVEQNPKPEHPRGWNAFVVKIRLRDNRQVKVLGLPALELDIAAPEALGSHAVAPMEVEGHTVNAYTLERIAGEKLRAFLSSLPTYRNKLKRPGNAVRAKDVYDIARIMVARPISNGVFWTEAGEEFYRACESRYVDCKGMASFEESMMVTRTAYETETTIPRNIPFQDAWDAVTAAVGYWEAEGVIPFEFEVPGS